MHRHTIFLKKAFARFRCSSHKFNIELGRHRGIARADIEFAFIVSITITYLLLRMNIMHFLNVINLMPKTNI